MIWSVRGCRRAVRRRCFVVLRPSLVRDGPESTANSRRYSNQRPAAVSSTRPGARRQRDRLGTTAVFVIALPRSNCPGAGTCHGGNISADVGDRARRCRAEDLAEVRCGARSVVCHPLSAGTRAGVVEVHGTAGEDTSRFERCGLGLRSRRRCGDASLSSCRPKSCFETSEAVVRVTRVSGRPAAGPPVATWSARALPPFHLLVPPGRCGLPPNTRARVRRGASPMPTPLPSPRE